MIWVMADVGEPERAIRQRVGGRSARVREAVFGATLALLAEGGLEALTVAGVAARAGVHETSIYRRWKTKEALVVAAIYEHTAEAIPLPDTGSVRTDLIVLLRSALRFLRSPLGSAVVRTSVALPASDETSSLRRAFWARRFPEALAILARGVERGEIAPGVDHQLMLELFIGLFHLRVFVIDDPNDDGLPERVVDLVLTGASRPASELPPNVRPR
jgi:AcrR family transcriptional regulator